jgi:hypothetical protein
LSVYFDVKDPAESVPLTFDFGLDLASGETLSGYASVAITVLSGTDPMPANLLAGQVVFDSTATKVIVPVQGGVNGCVYEFVVKCATTNPYKNLVWVALLPVNR